MASASARSSARSTSQLTAAAALSLPPRQSSSSADASAAAATSSSSSFTALTYNILAKSLGTCAIPWVLPRPSPPLLRRIESSGGRSWEELKDGPIKGEYMRHFHKNFDSGNYAAMRGFWAAKDLRCSGDVPEELGGLKWAGEEDRVSYRRRESSHNDDDKEEDDANVEVATTLRGVLRRELPEDTALDLFDEISSREEGVYRWNVRGPRIFRSATSVASASATATGDGSVSNESSSIIKPDLIALQEYDVHSVVSNYRGLGVDDPAEGGGEDETFADAMSAAGYDGAFFKDPLRGRTPPSGLGLFWNRKTFAPSSQSDESEPESSSNRMTVLEPDESALGGSLHNADLRECWHPAKPSSMSEDADSVPVLMPPADRRNAAFARLRHLPTGRTVLACAVHLMTTSRDCARTNWYPGEVRAGELAAVGELVKQRSEKGDEVLLLGDLNTDALAGESGAIPAVFQGRIRRADSVATKSFPSASPPKKVLEVDTGFNSSSSSFHWGDTVLLDAFSDVHKWGDVGRSNGEEDEGSRWQKPCTSKNADRAEWIDYVFSSSGLAVTEKARCEPPDGPVPNEVQPSDHLPLWARFEFV